MEQDQVWYKYVPGYGYDVFLKKAGKKRGTRVSDVDEKGVSYIQTEDEARKEVEKHLNPHPVKVGVRFQSMMDSLLIP